MSDEKDSNMTATVELISIPLPEDRRRFALSLVADLITAGDVPHTDLIPFAKRIEDYLENGNANPAVERKSFRKP